MQREFHLLIARAITLWLVFNVASCGNAGKNEGATTDNEGRATTTRTSHEACELLTASELGTMAGGSVVSQDLGYSEAQKWSACVYLNEDEQNDEYAVPVLELQVTWEGGKAKAEEELRAGGKSLQAIDGIEDRAYFSTSVGQRALLLKDDVLVELYMSGFPLTADYMNTGNNEALREQFEPLARIIASRL